MIDICFCSDEKIIDFIPVVINSILNKNSHHTINIHYIHNIEKSEKLDVLTKYIARFDNFNFFSYKKTWKYQYKGLTHVSMATMLRIYIPELLISCNKVIYLDVDIIVNLDLLELYNIDCGETGIAIKNSIYQNWENYFSDSKKKIRKLWHNYNEFGDLA